MDPSWKTVHVYQLDIHDIVWKNKIGMYAMLSTSGRFRPIPRALGLVYSVVDFLAHRKSRDPLTHWGRVTHICVSKLTIIGSDNGLAPDRRQAIIWTNAGILLIRTLGTNFSEIRDEIHSFSFKKMHLKMSAKWRLFSFGLNELTTVTVFQANHGPFLSFVDNWLMLHMYCFFYLIGYAHVTYHKMYMLYRRELRICSTC